MTVTPIKSMMCPTCAGRGALSICPECRGKGNVIVDNRVLRCRRCGGGGKVPRDPGMAELDRCAECRGTGVQGGPGK
jgi:primosomal protein N'